MSLSSLSQCDLIFENLCIDNLTVKKKSIPSARSRCKSKGEKMLFDKLVGEGYDVRVGVCFSWCRGDKGYAYPFDFEVGLGGKWLKLIIELDGDQHFISVKAWTSPEDRQKIDKIKMDKAKENGYCVIRILHKDVFYNRISKNGNSWFDDLKQELYERKSPCVVFIGGNTEYNCFKEDSEKIFENEKVTYASETVKRKKKLPLIVDGFP